MTVLGRAIVLKGDARQLPLPDASVDLIVTSPPYWGLRSYQDGGQHYDGQIGAEPTPREYVNNLIACTREWMRVLKPAGNLFVNLGDSYYSGKGAPGHTTIDAKNPGRTARRTGGNPLDGPSFGIGRKSLVGVPWRYVLRCIDDLGLILRAEIIWSKTNGLPESVTDRVRRSHETWFHLVKQPRYFSAVDHIRQPFADDRPIAGMTWQQRRARGDAVRQGEQRGTFGGNGMAGNPLGALPGSVWQIPTQPFAPPPHLAVDHYACVDTETEILTRRGWLRHDQVRAGDEAAGYDLDTGTARWTQVHAVHSYDYDGELVAVDKRDLSMRLTPNHRTIAQKKRGVHGHRGPIEVVRADELTPYHFIPRSAEWADELPNKSIGVDLAALCGWTAAEGWYQPNGDVYLCQSPDANPDHVNTIRVLLARLGPQYQARFDRGVYQSRDKWRARAQHNGERSNLGTFATRAEAQAVWRAWRDEHDIDGIRETTKVREWRGRPASLTTWRVPRGLAAEVRRLMPDKRLTWELANLPADEARALLDAFIDGDGHRRRDGRIAVFQHLDNKITVDVLQAIAVRLGYKTSLRNFGGKWVLYLTTGGRSITLRGTNGINRTIPREHYRGVVWCPTTGTGTFIARRNGQVFVTGNSFPPEWPRRLILGWSPSGICTACGDGRRPVPDSVGLNLDRPQARRAHQLAQAAGLTEDHFVALLAVGVSDTGRGAATQSGTGKNTPEVYGLAAEARAALGGYAREYLLRRPTSFRQACACPEPDAPTTRSTVLDPFGGTGTTAMVARALGRTGISVDRSGDYCRLAQWRVNDRAQIAKVLDKPAPPDEPKDMDPLFDLEAPA